MCVVQDLTATVTKCVVKDLSATVTQCADGKHCVFEA